MAKALLPSTVVLPKFSGFERVFLETTKSEHNHGGPGWEFGTCLWSPTRNAGGARSYEVMKTARPGDLVLHNYNYPRNGGPSRSYLCGYSIVSAQAVIRDDEPPTAGVWAGRKNYYRVEITDYVPLPTPLEFRIFTSNYSQALREIIEFELPKFFPFTISGGIVRYNQGMYLTRVPGILYSMFLNALGIEAEEMGAQDRKELHDSYAEGERARREVGYFLRHPKLAKDAKKHYGYKCQLCGFEPGVIFGKKRGATSLDCHHLDPLSERVDFNRPSNLNDVTVLCANCHRLVHSRRPALTIKEARAAFVKHPFMLAENLGDRQPD